METRATVRGFPSPGLASWVSLCGKCAQKLTTEPFCACANVERLTTRILEFIDDKIFTRTKGDADCTWFGPTQPFMGRNPRRSSPRKPGTALGTRIFPAKI